MLGSLRQSRALSHGISDIDRQISLLYGSLNFNSARKHRMNFTHDDLVIATSVAPVRRSTLRIFRV